MEADEAIKQLKEKNVKFLNICIIDMLGSVKCMMLNSDSIGFETLEYGAGFDGSSIIGYSEIYRSDLVAKPDLKTLVVPKGSKIAYVLSHVYTPEGKPFECDPRTIAKKFIEKLEGSGYIAYVAPELEFFLYEKFDPTSVLLDLDSGMFRFKFSSNETGLYNGYNIGPKKGYFSVPPHDKTVSFRATLTEKLEEMGITLVKSHHEVASMSQVEVNLKHSTPLETADNLSYLKMFARITAEEFGLRVTFMPKPIYGDNGSGLHVHLSVWDKSGKNLFYDADDEYAEISEFARYFIGGVLTHAKGLSAIVAPTVNSYKRLVMGYEAPIYISWGKSNRSALIRIPYYKKNDAKGKRIEIRFPDPSSNPYLTFVALIASGLDGVEKKIDPGDPSDFDLYSTRGDDGLESLPRDLWEALEHLEKDNVLKKAIGECIFEQYLQYKRGEYLEYAKQITLWEYLKYLNI